MPNIYDLLEKKHVSQHPLFANRKKNTTLLREAYLKHAQQMQEDEKKKELPDPNDIFSQAAQSVDEAEGVKLPDVIRTSIRATEEVLSEFDFPLLPKVSYNKSKNVKYSSVDKDAVVSGIVVMNCRIATVSGAVRQVEIPVSVVKGSVIPPSVMIQDGRMHVISQSTVDELVQRATSYELMQTRSQFSPPLTQDEREIAVAMRNEIGWQPREISGLGDTKMARSKEGAYTPGNTPPCYGLVVEDMEKAKEDGTDTFPRAFQYILRNYILNHVNTASKDSWEVHLINDGWCLNPYARGMNRRGRKAQIYSDTINRVVSSIFRDSELRFEAENILDDNFIYPEPFNADKAASELKAFFGEMYEGLSSEEWKDVAISLYDEIGEDRATAPYDMRAHKAQIEEEEDFNLIEPKTYNGTKMPIEVEDKIKFEGHEGPIRGTVVEIDPENDYLIVKSKGIEYRVHCEDITPLNSTYKNKWAKRKKAQDFDEDRVEPEEDDCFIQDVVRGGYDVSCGGEFLDHFDDYDDALAAVNKWQDENNFWPNIWEVSDHGSLMLIDREGREIKASKEAQMDSYNWNRFFENVKEALSFFHVVKAATDEETLEYLRTHTSVDVSNLLEAYREESAAEGDLPAWVVEESGESLT